MVVICVLYHVFVYEFTYLFYFIYLSTYWNKLMYIRLILVLSLGSILSQTSFDQEVFVANKY